MSGFRQGLYEVKNKNKYVGDVSKVVYRSSWEQKFNAFLDGNPGILEWASEPFAIPYIKPTDGRVHRYFVDYWIRYRDKHGNIKTELIEVKPKSQTKKSRSRNSKTRLYEDVQYAINIAKWQAAKRYANQQGWEFRVITENELFR